MYSQRWSSRRPGDVWSRLLSALVALTVAGCFGPRVPIDRPLPDSPHPPVTVTVDWQIDLVDNGFFPYAPTELGQVSLDRDGRRAYLGTSEGRLVAVSTTSGDVLWEREIGEAIDGTPLVVGDSLFVGAADGGLYAIDASGGVERWRFQAGGNLDSAPAVTDGTVVFANGSGTIVAVDRASGQLRWTADDEDPVLRITRGLHPPVKGQASPLVVEDRVYAGFPNGRLSALDVRTGTAVWTTDLANDETRHIDVDELPVLIDGKLIAASFAGGLYALDPDDGDVLWRRDIRGATRPIAWEDTLLTTSVDGRLIALGVVDGSLRWSLELEDQGPGRIHLMGNYVVVPTSQGALYVVDAGTPHIHVRYRPNVGFASAVVGRGGRVLALDNDGILHGLRLIRQ